MDWGSPSFVIAIIAVSYGAWLINNWIRAKHGYELEDEWGGKSKKSDTAESQRLRTENRDLHAKLDTMQDRMVVLERIVTDKGYLLNEEIESLRHSRRVEEADSGVPLNINSRERA